MTKRELNKYIKDIGKQIQGLDKVIINLEVCRDNLIKDLANFIRDNIKEESNG
jgi:hypothetical protein